MEKLLKDLKIGEEGIVRRVGGGGAVRRRLFDMGVAPGAPVKMRKLAPLGDHVEVTLRGYELTRRKNEAEWVFVDTVSE